MKKFKYFSFIIEYLFYEFSNTANILKYILFLFVRKEEKSYFEYFYWNVDFDFNLLSKLFLKVIISCMFGVWTATKTENFCGYTNIAATNWWFCIKVMYAGYMRNNNQ